MTTFCFGVYIVKKSMLPIYGILLRIVEVGRNEKLLPPWLKHDGYNPGNPGRNDYLMYITVLPWAVAAIGYLCLLTYMKIVE